MNTEIMDRAILSPAFNDLLQLGRQKEIEGKLSHLQTEALNYFEERGLPTKKDEDWKYTDLSHLIDKQWTPAETLPIRKISRDDVLNHLVEGLKMNILVFVNGQYEKERSVIVEKNESILITTLQEARINYPDLVDKYFGEVAPFKTTGLTALNTALANDGAFLYVPKGKQMEHPVYILSFNGHEEENIFVQMHHVIVLQQGAHANIVEATFALEGKESWLNVITESKVAANAHLNYYKLMDSDNATTETAISEFNQDRDSLCNSYNFSLNGGLIRHDVNYKFNEPNGEAHMYGIYLPTSGEHFDNHTFVDHAMPNCFSNELYKGIIQGNGRAVFNGKVMVREDAQKTNAYQSNKNILLSKTARVDTKPQLEIFADDVKCSHGATVGQMDEEAIFYLRSRGISEEDAKGLMTEAFTAEVLETFPNLEIKQFFQDRVRAKLNQLL